MQPWSKSSLKSLLEGCAWQWALNKLGNLPSPATPQTAAGTGVHAAIEQYVRARLDGTDVPDRDTVLAVARAAAGAEADTIDDHGWAVSDVDRDGMLGLVDSAVGNWWDVDAGDGLTLRETLDLWTPVAVEPYFSCETEAGSIHGYIDWIGQDDNGWVVVDYKTASSLRRWPAVQDGIGIEAAVYLTAAVASDVLPADENVRMEWHVAVTKGRGARRVMGPTFSPELVEFLRDRIGAAEQMVAERRLPTKPTWNLCSERWCPFYHGCQVTGSLGPDAVVL